MPTQLIHVRLDAPVKLLPELASFYGSCLGLPLARSDANRLAIDVGESVLEFRAVPRSPYYHFALLVPGDRFAAALDWAAAHVDLLPDPETGESVFDFTNWDARAVYFHDVAGSIVELISHHGLGETGATGAFSPNELFGVSEVGLVCDPPVLAATLERELGLEVWDGSVEGDARLAFVGEKGRTLILSREGRPWLPSGRPAEAHPVEVTLSGALPATFLLDAAGRVTVTAS